MLERKLERKLESPKASASTSTAEVTTPTQKPSSALSSRISLQNTNLFSATLGAGTPKLGALPEVLVQHIASYLGDKEYFLALARVNRKAYAAAYSIVKAAMVKVLKDLVKEDDTVLVRKLLQGNPKLLLRTDQWDPEGKAYNGFVTTAYQDTLADPFSEEMRTLLEESFPGATPVEKLAHAALQAEEFEHARFDPFRAEKRNIMELTKFAYETYKIRYAAWAAAEYKTAIQPVRDAWTRVDLAQNQWSKPLRKIFSVMDMNERQTFEKLPEGDLPEPHFAANPSQPWLPGTVKGCDFRLMSVPEKQNLSDADFEVKLSTTADGHPLLIRQGEGEEASYHLYAPYIPLDQDASEWRVIPITDRKLAQLIKCGGTAEDSRGAAVDFSQETLPYSPVFADLYRFGSEHSLHTGSGFSFIYAVVGCGVGWGWTWAGSAPWAVLHRADGSWQNFVAVTTLYKRRAERLASHLVDLKRYLPKRPGPLRPAPGSS